MRAEMATKKVIVVNSSFVRPALPTPSSSVWLSNLDLFAAQSHVRVVYFFRNPSNFLSSEAASIMKASLARILVPYYPFAGRFSISSQGRREIKCTGEGSLFLEAVSNLRLDEFGVYTPSKDNCRLLVPTDGFDTLEKSDDGNIPILMVQLTTFKCGGICLGTAIHHQAADGISAMCFLRNWATATREPDRTIPTPCFERTSLRARSPPLVQFHHPEFSLRKRPEKQNPVSFNFLNVTSAQVDAIKASCGAGYSSYQCLAAYIWRCTCLARRSTQPNEEVRLLMTADVRRRMIRDPLPCEFVGNAIAVTVAIAPSAEVAAELQVARIRDVIENLVEDYVQSAVDYLELQEDKGRLARAAGNFSPTDISVTSWNKMPLYEIDFGWGSPEFAGQAAFVYPRNFVVMSNADGGFKIDFSLESDQMEAFVKLFHELLPAAAGGF